MITSAAPTAAPNLVQIVDGGLLGKWVKYNKIFFIYLYLFFINSPTGQTRRRIFTLDGSHDADSRKDVPFGGFVYIAPYFRGKIPRKPQFLGREQAFSSQTGKILKVSCYRNYCIDFKQILQNDRDHQVVVVGGPNRRPTNPRWRTAAILKTVKSSYVCNRLTDFDKIWCSDAYWPLTAD